MTDAGSAAQPDPATQQAARWAKEDSFSMRYGAPALLTGWFVTFLVFCLGLATAAVVSAGDITAGWYFLPLALIYGFPVAAIIGLPLAIVIAKLLRRVRDQRLHVLVFTVAIGAVMAVIAAAVFHGDAGLGVLWLGLWTATCAAIGRASVMKMVARRNQVTPGA